MSHSRRFVPLLLLAASASCASENVAGISGELVHALAYRSCGPTDGPAVAITLSTTPIETPSATPPYVVVYVWQPVERLTARPWSLKGERGEGGAWYHESATSFEPGTSGGVRIRRVERERNGSSQTVTHIEGTVDVVFPTKGRVRRSFRATWFDASRTMLCG